MDHALPHPTCRTPALRLLIIPGLHDSGPDHWQTWLQRQYRGAVRVNQSDWHRPDLSTWSAQIGKTLERHGRHTRWVAVAHSFGCLALAHWLQQEGAAAQGGSGIGAALLVAPADPLKFDLLPALRAEGLGLTSLLVGSETDPWMPLERAKQWAGHWGSRFQNLGAAGHINVESGHGPWPLARHHVDSLIRDQQRQRRIDRAHPMELNFAV